MINRQFTIVETAREGDLQNLQKLLAIKETNIDEQDSFGTTALIAAAENNHINVVNVLLLYGANINMLDWKNMSALAIAAKKGYADIVLRLLVLGAAVNKENIYHNSVLGLAIQGGHLNVVRMLLAHGASPLDLIEGHTAIEYVVTTNNLVMARELLAYRAAFTFTYRVIQLAIKYGHIDMILLFATSHEVDAGLALYISAREGNSEIVAALLSNHVKIDIQDGLALMIASELGHLKVVELILAHPEAAMAVNQVDILKMTALMLAAKSKHLEIVKSLLAAGADVNLQDTYGCSALFYALDNRQKPSSVALVRELLIWKANIRIDINIGNASIDFKKQPDVIQCIQEHIKEQKNYQELQKEMKSFFAGKVKLSETKNSFFFPTAIINIVDEYASPTIEVRPAKK